MIHFDSLPPPLFLKTSAAFKDSPVYIQGTKLNLTSRLHLGCLMVSLCSVPTLLTY